MGETPHTGFGEQLRRLRTRAGLSQETLAERAGLTVKGISALERGERRHPYPHTVKALVVALELSEADERELLGAIPRRRMPAAEDLQGTPAALERHEATPRPRRQLIGRDADIVAVGRLLLQAPGRLLTLTGPGGVGKTSLALTVAAELATRFAEGVAVVDLSPLEAPALVLPAIAAALDVRGSSGEPARVALQRALGRSHRLLVLDNLEHVLAAAAELGALLDACPRLVILGTSRAPLRLRNEQLFPLAPLALPGPGAEGAAELVAAASVQLFLRVAQQALPDFALTDANGATVAAICRRLDGLPLAIELAAARVRLLGATALLARLDQALQVLAGGARDLPVRQQTMRATIGWSYALLEPPEQALFQRLAVFAGGWSLDAAEAVTGSPDGSTLDGLTALVDHALVVVEDGGAELRYRLLETIHAFAAEQLRESGDEAATRDRHCAYYVELVGAHREGLLSGTMVDHWRAVAPDLENIRAAWAWAVRHRRHEELALMGPGIQTIAEVRGLFAESVARFREAVDALRAEAAGGPAVAGSLGQLLSLYGIRAARTGQLSEAEERLREGLGLLEGREELLARAGTLAWLGYVLILRGRYDEASVLLARGLALYQSRGHLFFVAFSASFLALTAVCRGADDALVLAEAAAAHCRANGHPRVLSTGLWVQSCAQLLRGDFAGAAASAVASREASEAAQDRWGAARARHQLGLVALARGDGATARTQSEESLAIARELREPWLQGRALVALGAVAQAEGRPAEARARLDEALTLGQAAGLPPLVLSASCGLAELRAADDPAAARALLETVIAAPAAEHATRERALALLRRLSGASCGQRQRLACPDRPETQLPGA